MLGRNNPCWCGSGKKYKKCHLGRSSQPAHHAQQRAAELRKRFSAKACLHPLAAGGECGGRIVRAHSVRRAGDLEPLSRDSHLYQLTANHEILTATGGKPMARMIGINKASTFNGFCAVHDRTTFAPLETTSFTATPEQCFLLFYRAWARETYTKRAGVESIEIFREADKGRTVREQFAIQSFVSAVGEGLTRGLQDVMFYKATLDKALLAGSFNTIRSQVMWFDTPIDFVCSGATYPYWDFAGRTLQPPGPDPRPAPISLSLLCVPTGGCAVFSWFADNGEAPQALVDSLLREARLSDGITRFAFSAFENVFIRPTWWEALPKETQLRLTDRMADYMSPIKDTPPTFFVDDGHVLTDWHVATTQWV